MSWHDEFEAIAIRKISQTSLSTKQDKEPENGFKPENTGRYYTLSPMSGSTDADGNTTVDEGGYSGGKISEVYEEEEEETMTLGKEAGFLGQYARHSALNAGQAVRDIRYLLNHPDADAIADEGTNKHKLESLKKRIASLINNVFYTVIPPHLHHDIETLSSMERATLKEWFLHGYAPWDYNVPDKESSLDTFRQMVKAGNCSSIATFNVDIGLDQVQKYSSDDSIGLKKDLRFSTIDKKYDLFYFDFSKIKKADLQYCLTNALAASKPLSAGFVTGVSSSDIDNLGFSRSSSVGDKDTFFIRKNDLSKISNVKISSETGDKAEFLCDVASSLEDKIAGLQPYHSLKYGAGLIFPYKKPQDVMYHMGSVSFPIDIIFVGSSGKIKKIAKDIAPGTQGTYGAADVSVVLEISGGASDSLGLLVGDIVRCATPSQDTIDRFTKVNSSEQKSLYIKNASFNRKISFGSFDILNMSSASLPASELIKSASIVSQKKDLVVYSFDDFLASDLGIISLSKDFSVQSDKFISSNLRCDLPSNKTAALANFLALKSFTPSEIRKAFHMLRDDLSSGKNVVIATGFTGDLNKLKSMILKRAAEEVIFDDKLHSVELVSMPTANLIAHSSELLSRFSAAKMTFKNITMEKSAGAPIPDEVKEQASKVIDILGNVKESLDDLLAAFKTNQDQYNKQRGNVQLVENSADSYRASCQRLSKVIVKMLLDVKKVIGVMNKIKDISSVDEKIDALSLSCKEFVTVAEEVFALDKNIKEPTFVDDLTEATSRIEKAVEDIDNNLKNFSDYILKDILNKKVLSR